MGEPEEPKEQSFEILEALAKISARDFRLGQFMANIGLDPNQSNLFYRQLIKEARENDAFIDTLLKDVFGKEEIISQLKADLSANEERVRTLTAKMRNLQNGTRQRSETIDNKVRQLEADSARLQDKVQKYDAITELLKGEIKRTTLKALSELYFDMHTEALNAVIYGQSPPDPAVLEKVRQELRQELRDILRIPQEELEKEMDKLRAKNVELQKNNTALALAYWALRQQGWVDTSPGETEEPQENNKARTEADFMKYLQDLADKHSNKTNRGGGQDID